MNNNQVENVGLLICEKVWLKNRQTISCINTPTISSWLLFLLTSPMQMEQTVCSEISAYKIQMQGNNPKVRIHHSEQGESLKSGLEDIQQTIS